MRGRWIALVPGILLLEACSHAPAPALTRRGGEGPSLLAGAAARVITPDLHDPSHPVFMAGLDDGLRAARVRDDLYARAIVLTDRSGASAGLVVLDLIGFFHDDVEGVREELRLRHPEVRLEGLEVASTHTHAGPDVIGLWSPEGTTVDGAYVARVRGEAVEAVAEAWRRRRPANLYVGRSEAPGLAIDTRLPKVIDDTVMVLGLREAPGGAGIAALVQWGSHPDVMGSGNSEISADFPRSVIARVEREWGGTALYASGALGGLIGSAKLEIADPDTGKEPASRARLAEIVGDRIGSIAMQALSSALGAGAAPDPALRIRSRPLFVPLDNPRLLKGLATGRIRARRLYPSDGSGAGWLPSEIPPGVGEPRGGYTLGTEVGVVDVGPAVLAFVPGELYPELAVGGIQRPQDPGADFQGAPEEPALRLRSRRPLFIIGLANDELGYLIPKSEWDSEPPYAYGRSRPQYGERNSCGPDTAAIVLEALADLL